MEASSTRRRDGQKSLTVYRVTRRTVPQRRPVQCRIADLKSFRQDGRQVLRRIPSNEKKQTAKTSAVNEAIDKLIEKNPFEVPQAAYDLIAYSLGSST